MYYYKKAKENGWKPPTYTLKAKVLNTNIEFEQVYSYTELINKLLEISNWSIPTEIKVIEYDSNMKQIDTTQQIIDEVLKIKELLCQN